MSDPAFIQPWPDRVEEMRRQGELIGMLMGVRFDIAGDTRAKIEAYLREIGAIK